MPMRLLLSHAVNGIDSEASLPTADSPNFVRNIIKGKDVLQIPYSFSPSHRLLGRPRTGCVSHFRLQRETSLFFFPNAFTHTAPFNRRSQHS